MKLSYIDYYYLLNTYIRGSLNVAPSGEKLKGREGFKG